MNKQMTMSEISDELKTLLRYIDSQIPENDYTRQLDNAVQEVRRDEKWRVEYMRLNEVIRENRRLGEYRAKISQVRKSKDTVDEQTLIGILLLTPVVYHAIVNAIDAHPDWDDEQIAETISFE